tara:strand:+ start:2000 stop:2377 length:378 start_codon:yes stop_codon:yes gene_type:complete
MGEINNNKRKNDGRKNNKRQDRIKIIKDKNLPAPMVNKTKKDRAKMLSKKAISNIFKGEDGIWNHLAEMAAEGNMKAMEMLMNYQYGKSGEAKAYKPTSSKAPVIQFNLQPKEEKVIDVTPDEDE